MRWRSADISNEATFNRSAYLSFTFAKIVLIRDPANFIHFY